MICRGHISIPYFHPVLHASSLRPGVPQSALLGGIIGISVREDYVDQYGVLVLNLSKSSVAVELGIPYGFLTKIYFRKYYQGSWSEWIVVE